MVKVANYIEIENACNCLWITTSEIQIILGSVSKSKADSFRLELENQLDNEKIEAEKVENPNERNKLLANCFYYKDTRPHRLPIRRVLEAAHVDLDYIRREANKMRKAKRIEGEYEKQEIKT